MDNDFKIKYLKENLEYLIIQNVWSLKCQILSIYFIDLNK